VGLLASSLGFRMGVEGDYKVFVSVWKLGFFFVMGFLFHNKCFVFILLFRLYYF
jgi:hypothetical protein